jgi:hypothetical protein
MESEISLRFDNDQVMLFGVMAIEIKRKAPYAHTVCEIVKARYVTLFTQTSNHISLLCHSSDKCYEVIL